MDNTDITIKDYIERAEEITKKAIISKSEARKLLYRFGFITKRGKLRKEYRNN